MPNRANRRALASAHARRTHHADIRPELAWQGREQFLRACHRAGQRVADAHRDRRRRHLALLHDIEVRVECCDLIDFGLRQLHFSGERRHVRGRDVPVPILNEMQMLDQQVAPARLIAQQRADFGGGLGIDLTALGRAARFSPAWRRAVSVRRHRSSGYSWIRIEPFQTRRQSRALHGLIDKPYRLGYHCSLIFQQSAWGLLPKPLKSHAISIA